MTFAPPPITRSLLAWVLGTAVAATPAAWAQTTAPSGQPAAPSAATPGNKVTTRSTSIPARGLFNGDQLSESTKRQLTDLMFEAIGSRIELALLVPTGPWQIDGAGQGDTQLNTARLQALRRFLTDRGVDPNKVIVESRIDEKIQSPRLDVQLITTPAAD